MNIQHEIDKKNGTVRVTATLPPRNGNKVSIREEYVRNYLIEHKVRVSNCVQTAFVSNSIPPYSGTWVFELDNGTTSVVESTHNDVSPTQPETKADSPKAKTQRKRKTQTKEA